jgi:hypothetical protein
MSKAAPPLSRSYIEDVDTAIANANPRASVDSVEVAKLFEKMPEAPADESAREVSPSMAYAFPQRVKESRENLMQSITQTVGEMRLIDDTVLSLTELSNSSRFDRVWSNNTFRLNTHKIDSHIDNFRANDYRVLSHDYRSTDPDGHLPEVRVFSTTNSAMALDDQICTRRTLINGESHFIVKYGANGAFPGSGNAQNLYAKLANRLSLFPSGDGKRLDDLAVDYNLDPRSQLSLHLRDVDIAFHDFGSISVEVLIDAKKLAEYFDGEGFTGKYAHVYLDELVKAQALLGIWVAKNGQGAMVADVVNSRQYALKEADSKGAENMWHVCDIRQDKKHIIKMGSMVSLTAYSGKELAKKVNDTFGEMKYGTMAKAIHDNEKPDGGGESGRLENWLTDPRLKELYETHDDALFRAMVKDLGKLHVVNVTLKDGRKVPSLAASFDFLDVERERELALLFSTYSLMEEHLREKQESGNRKVAKAAGGSGSAMPDRSGRGSVRVAVSNDHRALVCRTAD